MPRTPPDSEAAKLAQALISTSIDTIETARFYLWEYHHAPAAARPGIRLQLVELIAQVLPKSGDSQNVP